MRQPYRLFCLTMAVLLAVGTARADDPITLRYKMGKDNQLVFRTLTELTQTQNVNNTNIQTDMSSEDISVRTLQKIDEEGNFEVQTENKRLRLKLKSDRAGEYKFDSKSDDHDKDSLLGKELTPLYSRLSGAILTFTHTPRGEIKSVKGYQELLAEMLKDNPIAAQFAGGGSDEAAKLGFGEFFVVLSENPIKPGDKWESVFELQLAKLGKANGKKVYTYQGPDKLGDRTTAKISVRFELSFNIDLDLQGTKVSGSLSTTESTGTVQFDPVKGQILSMTTGYTLRGDLTVVAAGKTIPIQMDQKQTTTVELLEKLPE